MAIRWRAATWSLVTGLVSAGLDPADVHYHGATLDSFDPHRPLQLRPSAPTRLDTHIYFSYITFGESLSQKWIKRNVQLRNDGRSCCNYVPVRVSY